MKRTAWILALLFYASLLPLAQAAPPNAKFHNVASDGGNISGFDNLTLTGNITGDNTGRLQGMSIGSASYTDNGYFQDLITKGPRVDVRAFGTITFGTGVSEAQKTANTATIQAAHDNVTGAGARLLIPRGGVSLGTQSTV